MFHPGVLAGSEDPLASRCLHVDLECLFVPVGAEASVFPTGARFA